MLKKLKGSKSVAQHRAPIQKLTQLCQTCQGLKAQLEVLRQQESFSHKAGFDLGLLPNLFARREECVLCRLIVDAIVGVKPQNGEQLVLNLDPAYEVKLRWQSEREFVIGSHSHERRVILFDDDERQFATKTDRFIYKSGNGHAASLPPARGRIPSVRPTDLDQMRHWLATCRRFHGAACQKSSDLVQDWFHSGNPEFCRTAARLIDVRSYCIVNSFSIPRDSDSEFIALSYIWGEVSPLRLTSGNIDRLMQANSLKQLWQHLPRTVQDAITLTRSFGVPYLWVDALCLIQNSKYDLRMGIEWMYMIYDNALFTIVAAAGSDANADLPGVRSGTRDLMQQSEDLGEGIRAIVIPNLDSHLARSKYMTRAWT